MQGLTIRLTSTILVLSAGLASSQEIPRTADGKPDFSGFYDTATLTPMQRPQALGERLTLTDQEAAKIAADRQALIDADLEASNPNREAPPEGGDGSPGAAGNVGGYNTFWVDPGEGSFKIDGKWRTSILVDPPNGRYPAMTPDAQAKRRKRFAGFRRGNDGTAYWLEKGADAPGPYDNMEQRPFGERCILGFGSTAGPPMLPVLYNNLKRIVQTEDTVIIGIEMNHEARVVRMGGTHDPSQIRKWLGDSIGRWEGDTLVVETINFRDSAAFTSASRDMKVTERFAYLDNGNLLYRFTVEDPAVWTKPFSGEMLWPRSDNKLFEYACHEGNYSLGGIMRGARLLEQNATEASAGN